MTLLSRKVEYALLILWYLHHKPGTARAIADRFGLSRPFVANILKELCHHGYVTSQRGIKGGYALARACTEISLAELIETLEGHLRLTVCSSSAATAYDCNLIGQCVLQGPLGIVHQRLLEVMRETTLANLFDTNGLRMATTTHPLPVVEPAAGPATMLAPTRV